MSFLCEGRFLSPCLQLAVTTQPGGQNKELLVSQGLFTGTFLLLNNINLDDQRARQYLQEAAPE